MKNDMETRIRCLELAHDTLGYGSNPNSKATANSILALASSYFNFIRYFDTGNKLEGSSNEILDIRVGVPELQKLAKEKRKYVRKAVVKAKRAKKAA